MKVYGQNGHVPIVDIEEILLLNVVSLMLPPLRRRLLRIHVTDQIRGRWPMNSAKKEADYGARSHTGHDCFTFFSAAILQANNGERN